MPRSHRGAQFKMLRFGLRCHQPRSNVMPGGDGVTALAQLQKGVRVILAPTSKFVLQRTCCVNKTNISHRRLSIKRVLRHCDGSPELAFSRVFLGFFDECEVKNWLSGETTAKNFRLGGGNLTSVQSLPSGCRSADGTAARCQWLSVATVHWDRFEHRIAAFRLHEPQLSI
jgi:hypothetical protein